MKNSSKIILAILIVFGSFLRIYNIGFQCIWTEEAYTLAMAKLPLTQILTTFDFNPPIYYILAHFSYLIFGGCDVAIRYPSVAVGILLIPAMYWLGAVYKNELTGIYCAAFTTIVFPGIYFSQYARAYELSVFSFVILLVFYISVKRGDGNEPIFWLVAVWNAWVHLFVLIPIGLLCIDLLLDRWQRWFYAILAFISISPPISIIYSVWTNRSVSSGVSYGATAIQMIVLIPIEFFNVLFLNIIVLFGFGAWLDKDPLRNRLIIITVITLIVGIICSNFTPVLPRYLMTVSMIILLFASNACVELGRLCKLRRYEIIIFIGIFLIFTWMAFPNFESHYWIQQYIC
jgi:mannosyltransferase